MQVIGLCRFSYPALGGFQVDFETLEDKLAYLYAPDRMEERFRTFQTVTLPSLQGQTDPDFSLVVLVGESLPRDYRTRLETLLSTLSQAVLVSRPPRPHRDVTRRVINSQRRFDGSPCLQFRMDDDDAVAVDFVERLRRVSKDIDALAATRRYVAIDFNRGFVAQPGPKGLSVAETQTPYQTAALGIRFAPNVRQTVMNFAHHKLAQNMTTVTIADEDMLIRGHSAFNDSRQGPNVSAPRLKLLDSDGEAYFKTRFNIDTDTVRAAWSP